MPAESLEEPDGIDCDDSAILLCSILRVYIPADKVFCAVGMWSYNGRTEGHMFVVVQNKSGEEFILESTASPDADVKGSYDIYALFNDKYTLATKQGLSLFGLRPIEEEEVSYA
jgi:hypothetical protein